MDLMNWIFQPFLDLWVILFSDNILLYSKSKERHDVSYPTHEWIWQQ